jgi:hypothetical protein
MPICFEASPLELISAHSFSRSNHQLSISWLPPRFFGLFHDKHTPFWNQSNRTSTCALLSMSLCFPSMAPLQALPRSSAPRGHTLSFSFLLLVVFIILVSVKLISEPNPESHVHALGKRQFQTGALFGDALQQVCKLTDNHLPALNLTRKNSHIGVSPELQRFNT